MGTSNLRISSEILPFTYLSQEFLKIGKNYSKLYLKVIFKESEGEFDSNFYFYKNQIKTKPTKIYKK
jgi:hypothetical protein